MTRTLTICERDLIDRIYHRRQNVREIAQAIGRKITSVMKIAHNVRNEYDLDCFPESFRVKAQNIFRNEGIWTIFIS